MNKLTLSDRGRVVSGWRRILSIRRDFRGGGDVGLGGAGREHPSALGQLHTAGEVAAVGVFGIDLDLCRRYAASSPTLAEATRQKLQTERDRLVDGDFTGVPHNVTIEDWFHQLEQALAVLTNQ